MPSDKTTKTKQKKSTVWSRPNMSHLEADIAYFDARICMIEDKSPSCYHAAELKVYKTLVTSLRGTLDRLVEQRERIKKRRLDAQKKKRDEYKGEYLVEELDPTSILVEEIVDIVPELKTEEDRELDEEIILTLPE